MTWTLSSDWCISRRIASQIKRSSTPEPPLTTSPRHRRRRTVVRRHQLSSVPRPSLSTLSLFVYLSVPIYLFCLSFALNTHRETLWAKTPEFAGHLHGLVPSGALSSSKTVNLRERIARLSAFASFRTLLINLTENITSRVEQLFAPSPGPLLSHKIIRSSHVIPARKSHNTVARWNCRTQVPTCE